MFGVSTSTGPLLLILTAISQVLSTKMAKLPTRIVPLGLRMLRPLQNEVEEAIFMVSERWYEVSRVQSTSDDFGFYPCLLPLARIAFERDTVAYRPVLAKVLARCNEGKANTALAAEIMAHQRILHRRSPYSSDLSNAIANYAESIIHRHPNFQALDLYQEATALSRTRYHYFTQFGDSEKISTTAMDLALVLGGLAKTLIIQNRLVDARMRAAEAMAFFPLWQPLLSRDAQQLSYKLYDIFKWISGKLQASNRYSEAMTYLLDCLTIQRAYLSISGYLITSLKNHVQEMAERLGDNQEARDALEWLDLQT